MKRLDMKDSFGNSRIVDVDDAVALGYGGIGTVYDVVGDPSLVVKTIPMDPPKLVGDMGLYIAHIRTTRERLLAIKKEEEDRKGAERRRFVIEFIDEVLERVLPSHWTSEKAGLHLTAVWYLQLRAPGKSLLTLFREVEPPPNKVRQQIANALLTRLKTLGRAGLVHLDCVPDNIFVDLAREPAWTTLIDLDGCGIVRRGSGGDHKSSDEWEQPPFTLGHLKSVRPPPWYPQLIVPGNPRSGNYLFAERWVVLDTLIRILSWNRVAGALAWLKADHRTSMSKAYWDLGLSLENARRAGETVDQRAWKARYTQVIETMQGELGQMPKLTVKNNHPPGLKYFTELAQEAFFNPRTLPYFEEYRQKVWQGRVSEW